MMRQRNHEAHEDHEPRQIIGEGFVGFVKFVVPMEACP